MCVSEYPHMCWLHTSEETPSNLLEGDLNCFSPTENFKVGENAFYLIILNVCVLFCHHS